MARYILETPEALDETHTATILGWFPSGTVSLKPEARKLHIVGRRWFQKTYGNTYHTVEVFIDGKRVHKAERQYGYGDQYLTTAVHWLQSAGHIPEGITGHIGTRYLREESGFDFSYECHDVTRQRDL